MKSQTKLRALCCGMVILLMASGALAQTPTQVSFSGSIADFTPASVAPAGPWQIQGQWSLMLKGQSGMADFSAVLTMVRSDLWVSSTNADVNNPAARTPHTHHVTLQDGVVTFTSNGFRVDGTATVTGNGNPAPFGGTSPIEIEITGGSSVAFSNIKVTFGAPAAGHFGTQPLEGAVGSAQ